MLRFLSAFSLVLLVGVTACRSRSSEEHQQGSPSVPAASVTRSEASAEAKAQLRAAVAKFDVWRAGIEAELRRPDSEVVKNGPCNEVDICHAELESSAPPNGIRYLVEWYFDNPALHRVMLLGAPADPSFDCQALQSKKVDEMSVEDSQTYECKPDGKDEVARIGTNRRGTRVSWFKEGFLKRQSAQKKKP